MRVMVVLMAIALAGCSAPAGEPASLSPLEDIDVEAEPGKPAEPEEPADPEETERPEDPEEPADPEEPTEPEQPTGPAAPTTANGTDEKPAPPRKTTAIDVSGDMGSGFCDPTGCLGVRTSDRWFELSIDGMVRELNLTLSWTAESPLMESLRITFAEMDGGHADVVAYESVVGTSPLNLQAQDLEWTTGQYAIEVWYDRSTGVSATYDQTFDITGTVTAET